MAGLVLGWTIPQPDIFYGAPTLAARLGAGVVSGPVGSDEPAPGAAIGDEWWRVTDDDGIVVGYGWLDSEWGAAQIALLVDRARRGAGIGNFILNRLEDEAAEHGLNYIYNVVPDTHPDADRMTRWLTERGFTDGTGDLRRHVPAANRRCDAAEVRSARNSRVSFTGHRPSSRPLAGAAMLARQARPGSGGA